MWRVTPILDQGMTETPASCSRANLLGAFWLTALCSGMLLSLLNQKPVSNCSYCQASQMTWQGVFGGEFPNSMALCNCKHRFGTSGWRMRVGRRWGTQEFCVPLLGDSKYWGKLEVTPLQPPWDLRVWVSFTYDVEPTAIQFIAASARQAVYQ
jgi:hypothetical protein